MIRETSTSVLTRAQQKEKQASLNKNQEFCMYSSFISKLEPKNMKIALDHANWLRAMQYELN